MRARTLSTVLLALVAAAFLPLRSDGDQASCCNVTTSLASTVAGPVVGDEAFFKLPNGPANVMFLLDVSGSMAELPQCGDYDWDDSAAPATCKSPTLANPTAPTGSARATVTGTCLPATDGTGPALAWMEQVMPSTTYADPGRTNSVLWDCPPWGNGGSGCTTKCSGNSCLFDPAAYYTFNSNGGSATYRSWTANSSGVWSAKREETDTGTGVNAACVAMDTAGNKLTDCDGNPVSLGAGCTACMNKTTKGGGFYFYKVSYANSCKSNGDVKTTTTVGPAVLFKGNFLNANPPKFLSALNVVKRLAWMDPADTGNQAKLDQIRLGLTIISPSSSKPQQARLIVPLGPDKGNAYPPTQDKFRQARQYIVSAINHDQSIYKDSSNNTVADGTTMTGGFFDPANGGTPLGSALFNIGQYFTSTGVYNTAFGSKGCKNGSGTSVSCQVTDFNETAKGDVNAAWVTASGNTQCSICWACQTSSVVVITDGSPNSEITFPSAITGYDTNSYTSTVNCGGSSGALSQCAFCPAANVDTSSCAPTSGKTACQNCTASTLCGASSCTNLNPCNCIQPVDSVAAVIPRVASWLHNNDLRADAVMTGKQLLTIHTIGFNVATQTDPRARDILKATANMGAGSFSLASNATELATAVYNAVNMVIPKEDSFSAATTTSLQTVQTAQSEAYLTRFKPNQTPTWEGHVFEGLLFDEALNGCDPNKVPADEPQVSCGTKTVSANFNGNADVVSGLSICSETFLVDADCDEVSEDPQTGNFVKKGSGLTPANFPWDAGAVLSSPSSTGYRSADEGSTKARNIFTYVNGTKVAFTAANAATLKPYMNIGSAWCTAFLSRIGASAGSDAALECAKEIIYFVRGWDVLDQDGDGCAGPGNTPSTKCSGKGEERDRVNDSSSSPFFWKLGDVFHSSPATVQAPIDEVRCDTGYERQCWAAIHSPLGLVNQTAMDFSNKDANGNTIDAYEAYRLANKSRKRVLLVGANDGMLHAFDSGTPDTTHPDLTGSFPYSFGTGEELWAFVPPDLLPRLAALVDGHQYMVDGSVMVRDIWVDGSGAASGKDGKKQKDEFHTIAVVGRRSGGTQYSALDVTDPTIPTLLWSFPQGCSDDARYMGESWADFAPRPPPIAPVKMSNIADPNHRGFDERWIVMINGGYDPSLGLGRAVFMVDAWAGTTLWRFTDDDFKSQLGFSGNGTSMFPVPGAIGLMDIGDPTTPRFDSDGFVDTATWGDMGGNLFVARFQNPGVIDFTTGRVGNWFAARAFEEQRRTDDLQSVTGRSEFFYMTANAFDPTTHTLRTMLGSGNREQIMQQTASCGTDNLFGCCQAGCTKVTATTTENYGTCSSSTSFACVNGMLQRGATTTTGCSSFITNPATAATCANTANFTESVALHWECPGAATTDRTGSISCDASGLCAFTPTGGPNASASTPGGIAQTSITSSQFLAPPHSRFYGVWSYGRDAKKMFQDATTAKAFDGNRFTDVAYTGTCSGPAGSTCALVETTKASVTRVGTSPTATVTTCPSGVTKCEATADDAGWFYEFGQNCPLDLCNPAPPWTDEKTSAGANVVLGCTFWSNFRPVGVTTDTDPCSGNLGTPVAYAYDMAYLGGTPSGICGYPIAPDTSGGSGDGSPPKPPSPTNPWKVVAGKKGATTSASTGGTSHASVSSDCNISYSVLTLNAGAAPSNTQMGTRTCGGQPVYYLEVPRELHRCRHVDAKQCK